MIFIRDKLTYEEVKQRFEREGYKLLSTEYTNAKANMKVRCPFGHDWTTNMSNFDFGRRCSTCSRRKKYALHEVKTIFEKEGYQVQESIYLNGKTPIKVICANGHETAISLNNFMNGRRCGLCRWIKVREARMEKIELRAKNLQDLPRRDTSYTSAVSDDRSDELMKEDWLDKIDEMRKSLRSTNGRTYQGQLN